MKKELVIVAGFAIAVGIASYGGYEVGLQSSQKVIDSLQDGMSAKYAEQKERCAVASKKLLDEELENTAFSGSMQNHYNKKLDVCFTLMTFRNDGLVTRQLADLQERRVYAFWMGDQAGKKTEKCMMNPAINKSMNCKSIEEFNDFTVSFLTE